MPLGVSYILNVLHATLTITGNQIRVTECRDKLSDTVAIGWLKDNSVLDFSIVPYQLEYSLIYIHWYIYIYIS